MKLTRYISCFLLSLTMKLSAQVAGHYTLQLRSGNYTPEANFHAVVQDEQVLQSAYRGHYHVLLQFYTLPNATELERIKNSGISLLGYIPSMAYLAQVPIETVQQLDKSYGIRSMTALQSSWKMDERLKYLAANSQEMISLNILLFNTIDAMSLTAYLAEKKGQLLHFNSLFGQAEIQLPAQEIKSLCTEPWIYWAEPGTPDMIPDNLPGKTLIRTNVLNANYPGARNLDGSGVNIGVWDGSGTGTHIDLDDHVTVIQPFATGQLGNHATHVAGTIAGSGNKDPQAAGMAPGASIYAWDYNGDVPSEMASSVNNHKIVLSNNSYGYNVVIDTCSSTYFRGIYDSRSRSLDLLTNNNPSLSNIFSAGNFQSQCGLSGFRTVQSGSQPSKNNIVVGALDQNEAMTNFSAWGPVRDNRLKPEVVAMGNNVNSCNPGSIYALSSGTSMSTPAVTGSAALLVQRYRQLNSNATPDAALLRAIIANSADDLGNPGPDYKYGFGRMNAVNAVKAIEENRYGSGSVSNGQSKSFSINVPANCLRVKVMITWNDPAAQPLAAPALVNNLDLKVINPFVVSHGPWVLNTSSYNNNAIRGTDSLNNIEQVSIDNPPAGAYTIDVNGSTVTNGSQLFYYTWQFDMAGITLTYPNGGESMVPNTNEQIRYSTQGVSGNLQLQYSLNNGQTWTTVSNAINAATGYYNWSVPSAATGRALLRLRTPDSTVSDVCDTSFTIINIPGGLNTKVCSKQINLSWNAVSGAIGYEPMLIVNGKYQSQGIQTGRVFTFYNLADNKEYWMTVRAITPDSTAGRYATGVNRTPSSTTLPANFNPNLPSFASVCKGSGITLKALVTGSGSISRQWQRSTNNGLNWGNISGSGDSLVLSSVPASFNQYRYRLRLFSNTCGDTVFSNTSILTIDTNLLILQSPVSASACNGQPVSFSYKSSSISPPVTRWQQSADSGKTWTDISQQTDTVLQMKALYTQNGQLYRAILANGCKSADTTASALLSVSQPILLQVNNDTTVCMGSNIQLKARASGGVAPLNYLWEQLGSDSQYTLQAANKTYRITVSDICSEPASDSVQVTVIMADTNWTHDATGQKQVSFTSPEANANSYNWDFGDGNTSAFRNTGHLYTANGTYKVCLTLVKTSCTYTSCQNIQITRVSRPEEIVSGQAISVYPNPSSGLIQLNFMGNPVQAVEVFDQLGRNIKRLSMKAGQQDAVLQLNEAENGLYTLKIYSGHQIVFKKILVLR